MDKFQMLSGEQLVVLGAKKTSLSLPELGLKDVFPNGSWLEQKQVQNALEHRKYLIEVERIDKCGSISHAEWKENLKLAEVTQKSGGHWQYLGHNVGKHLYIKPEEALFLMELNCLQLTYNDVTVSIQQAYSLLIGDNLSLIQYKVYASLGRLGYKVFRYDNCTNINTGNQVPAYDTIATTIDKNQISEFKNDEKDLNKNPVQNSDASSSLEKTSETKDEDKILDNRNELQDSNANEKAATECVNIDQQSMVIEDKDTSSGDNKENQSITMEVDCLNTDADISSSMNVSQESIENTNSNEDLTDCNTDICNTESAVFIRQKLQSLYSRELRPCSSGVVHESFEENLPDLFQKHIVTVKAPEEKLIPRNVFLNNTAYVLNMENLKLKKSASTQSLNSQNYSSSDDVNAHHVRRIRGSFSNESAQSNWNTQFFPRFPQQTNHFRQFNYWNNYNLNYAFQRQFFQSMPLRFQVFPRMQSIFRCFPAPNFMPNIVNPETVRERKRKRDNTKVHHLKSIKHLASKLKNLVNMGNTQVENIQALHRLIQTYNLRYKTKLELTEGLDVLENELILETINLDDDEQTSPKKRKNDDEDYLFDENFNTLKQLALKIKELEDRNESSPQHRRALSKAIRTFNKSYSADIYVDSNYEVINRRHIVIASSSDSEGTVETAPKPRKTKKLRNPFYIMKQLSEKQNAMSSQQNSVKESNLFAGGLKKDFKYSELLTSNVSKHWLPSEDDFGRAEVVQKIRINNCLLDHSTEFLYEFMKGRLHDSWLEAKIAYWQSCEETAKKFEASAQNQSSFNLESLVGPEDCTDLQSVLNKLNIIKNNKDVKEECSFKIDFDVYKRDVSNFKKTNKPKPHFRVICMDESSMFPAALDFATHQHGYTDDVSIVFAIVGAASVSYLQINATDLPVYIPTGNPP